MYVYMTCHDLDSCWHLLRKAARFEADLYDIEQICVIQRWRIVAPSTMPMKTLQYKMYFLLFFNKSWSSGTVASLHIIKCIILNHSYYTYSIGTSPTVHSDCTLHIHRSHACFYENRLKHPSCFLIINQYKVDPSDVTHDARN